jgi:hypothetical protein
MQIRIIAWFPSSVELMHCNGCDGSQRGNSVIMNAEWCTSNKRPSLPHNQISAKMAG